MKRLDQLPPLRILGDKNLDRLGPRSPRVLVPIPLRRRHLGKERLHLIRIIEQLPVQVARIPVDQNAPEIEDDRSQTCHITHPTTLALTNEEPSGWRRRANRGADQSRSAGTSATGL